MPTKKVVNILLRERISILSTVQKPLTTIFQGVHLLLGRKQEPNYQIKDNQETNLRGARPPRVGAVRPVVRWFAMPGSAKRNDPHVEHARCIISD